MSQNLPNGGEKQIITEGKKPIRHRSNFDLSYRLACTPSYGFATPFFKLDCVPDDKVSLRSGHMLRTLSLKSPLFQNLRMNKDFYAVPMKALLPKTWDLIYDNPVQGDDIDASKANTLIDVASSKTGPSIAGLFYNQSRTITATNMGASSEAHTTVTKYLRYICLLEMFFGKQSLFNYFHIPIGQLLETTLPTEKLSQYIGVYYSALYSAIDALKTSLSVVEGKDFMVRVDYRDDSFTVLYSRFYNWANVSSVSQMLYDIMENPSFSIGVFENSENAVAFNNALVAAFNTQLTNLGISATFDTFFGSQSNSVSSLLYNAASDKKFNVAPIYAYQMICAEYFTNDKVDFIYNASMFRDTLEGYLYDKFGSDAVFKYNGVSRYYDAFSSALINQLFALDGPVSLTSGPSAYVNLGFIFQLFSLRRALRYVDLFTGARTQPLAVGDVNVAVASNKVSVVDVTRSIQLQRFLNQVNRVGVDAKNYLKGIFGTEERQHIDVPVKIGHLDETVYGVETQNTAETQVSQPNSITTNLESKGRNFAFEFKCTESTIVIGLVSFDIRRFYNRSLDPFALKVDRFDMFNPYMQYIGDQPIEYQVLDITAPNDKVFGYTGRYNEYKLAFDYAIGDFTDTLDSYIFSAKQEFPVARSENAITISPEYIRQEPTELDKYYLAMTAKDLGSRSHFMLVFDNLVDITRNMVAHPQILG